MSFAQIVCVAFAVVHSAAMGLTLGVPPSSPGKTLFFHVVFITLALCGAFV